jgi:hypothetical protein
MHQGRGGMGSHKHGISGYPHRSAQYKMWMARRDNAERDARKLHRPAMFDTVQEAMNAAYADMKAKRT